MAKFNQTRSLSQKQESNFILTMFQEDCKKIETLVFEKEKEGKLFGLWTNCGNAVVFLATGQREDYQGSLVARQGWLTKGALCHIGEWYSHQPQSSKRERRPSDSQSFVLLIANIVGPGKVKLSPFKLDSTSSQSGHMEILPLENPFNQMIHINEGKEKIFSGHRKESLRSNPNQLSIADKRQQASQGYSLNISNGGNFQPQYLPLTISKNNGEGFF